MCKAKAGHEALGKLAGFLSDQGSCNMQFICQWTLPRVIRGHCEGKRSQPHHMILVCVSQAMFYNWFAEQKVYD